MSGDALHSTVCVTLLPVVMLAQPPVARHIHIFYGGLRKLKGPLSLRARVQRGERWLTCWIWVKPLYNSNQGIVGIRLFIMPMENWVVL